MDNTVTLDIETYNRLHEFEIGQKRGKKLRIEWLLDIDGFRDSCLEIEYYTDEEIVKELHGQIKRRDAKIIEVKAKIRKANTELATVHKMNYFQFKKWQRNTKFPSYRGKSR